MRRRCSKSMAISLFGMCLLSGLLTSPADPAVSSKERPESTGGVIPPVMVFAGTAFLNCQVDAHYPFHPDREVSTRQGVIEHHAGYSLMSPWRALVLDGCHLFNAHTKQLLDGPLLVGEHVEVRGYPGSGQITMRHSVPGDREKTIAFDKCWYVCEILGWQKIAAHPLNGDTGEIGTHAATLWIRDDMIRAPYPQEETRADTGQVLSIVNGTAERGYGVATHEQYTTVGMRESVVVGGRHLFDPVAKTQISRFSFLLNPLGKHITISGYPAEGATVSYERHRNAVTFDNVFYVCEIIGWKHMCFYDAYLQREQCCWVVLPEK